MKLAQTFVHHLAEHLGEPEIRTREHAENRRHSHNQMEVPDYEGGVVQRNVDRSLAEEETGDTARDEEGYEANSKEHRRGKANLSSPKRPQPIEGLDG